MTSLWKNNPIDTIATLREEAGLLLEKNNLIVDEIWKIDRQLNTSSPNPQSLLDQKTLLCQQLNTEKYTDQITALKQKIYQLEVEVYGVSHILDDSPYPGERGNDLLYHRRR